MAQTSRSNIAQFPINNPHAPDMGFEHDFGYEGPFEVAPSTNVRTIFVIDEPDPLLISENQSSEFIPDPASLRPELKVFSGGDIKKTGYLRIKDLHPIDLLIALGLIAVGFFF